MNFTEKQITKMKENLDKIVKYIEEEILPYVNYQYETPKFGPTENWGRFDENSGCRYSIKLNDYSRKINFCYAGIPYSIEENIPPKHMINFLEYWKKAKEFLQWEIQTQKEKNDIINNFQV